MRWAWNALVWQAACRLCPIFACLALGGSALPPHHTAAEYRLWCNDKDPEIAIAACTVLIDSRTETDANLESELKRRGSGYATRGKHNLAARDFHAALALDPKDAEAFFDLGLADDRRGDYESAIYAFGMTIRYRPKDDAAFFWRGDAYTHHADLDEALADYDRAIRINPQSPGMFHARALLHMQRHEFEDAYSDFDKAVRLDPKFAAAFNGRGLALNEKGDPDRAIDNFSMAVKLDPQQDEAFENRGNLFRLKGDYHRAIEDFTSAIAVRPTAGRLTARGIMFVTVGQYEPAARDFKTALRLDASSGYAAMWWHLALAEIGNGFWRQERMRQIRHATAKLDQQQWPWPLIAMFRGELTPDQAQSAAENDEQHCEAQFFRGEYQLLHGDAAGGKVLLQQSTEACSRASFERAAAAAELAKAA